MEDQVSHNNSDIEKDEGEEVRPLVEFPKRERLDSLNQLSLGDGTRPAT